MNSNPLVTVICLCYNHSHFLVEALNSLTHQNYSNIEIIIVDDFSTDNSNQLITNWLINHPKVKFIANEKNLGNTKSFNKALQLAKGEYIVDFATDDVLLPNCITLQLQAFRKSTYTNLGIVYGNAELITENGQFSDYFFNVNDEKKVIEKRKTGDIYTSVLSGGNCMCSVTAMIKKEVLDELKGYDEGLYYEDLDFWIRASRNYDFDFIDNILVQKRNVTNSLGTMFYKKNNARAKRINYSTYLILKKAAKLNRTKEENKAILKRIHFDMILAYKMLNLKLLLKFILLEIKVRMKLI
jgi:glycosyltransferase involved in cell wall biosynthesis